MDDQVKQPIFQNYTDRKKVVIKEIVDPEFKRDVYFLEARKNELTAAEKKFKEHFMAFLSAYRNRK